MQKVKLLNNVSDKTKSGNVCCGEGNECSSLHGQVFIQNTGCTSIKAKPPHWATGTIATSAGAAYRVSSEWSHADYWGMIKSRASAFRMNYSVPPGLYAVGEPTKDCDVFVTANYKLSFDTLRRSLNGMDAWVLVLDTKSINVWCAAGKGTFGADELVKRISDTRLDAVVSHRRIILPQLGAVGVNASIVQKRTGFRVSFGPVHAQDIPAYVEAKYKKTPGMSTIRFTMLDRLILTPLEINPAMRKFPLFAAVVLFLFGLQPSGILFANAWHGGLPFLVMGLLAVFAGAFLTPVFLPFVPFRAFAVKGWIAGLATVLTAVYLFGPACPGNAVILTVIYLFFPAASSYIALQFTGSTTFTGMSGVKKELKIGIPIYIAAASISLVLMIVFKLREWSVI